MSSEKNKKQKAPKPKYNAWQNVCYMISLAWREKEKKVPMLCGVSAILYVIGNIINLTISPAILSAIERKASLSELLITILIFVGAMMLHSAVSTYLTQNMMFSKISVRSALIAKINKKATTTSYPNTEDEKFTKLLTKTFESLAGNSSSTEAIWNSVTYLVRNCICFFIYLFLLSNADPVMMAVTLATSVAGYFINKFVDGYRYRHRDEVAEYEKSMWYINDRAKDYSAAKDIRIFGIRPWLEELSAKALEEYMAFQNKAENVAIRSKIADLLLAFLRNGIAYAYLIGLVLSEGLTASEFLLYFSAVSGFTSWVSWILNDLNTIHRQSLDISTVRECLEYPEPFRFEDGESLIPDRHQEYEIRLENVSYRYPGAEKDTLSHIDLTLHPGEKLAIVGLNGAGKTTLVKLLCGFLDPTEGRVLLNGKDIRDYNRRDYYSMFSAVFQEFSLLAGSITVNIAQTDENIDMEKVKSCADYAGLCKKIESLPQGYDTMLNREVYETAVMLSGGETQRLMLARALYKDACFIVLDEPTAALDPIAESDMYQKYNEMAAGRSSVYISHRLASTRFCDRIVFIENAGIAEEGTHDELLRVGGRYAELFSVQSKYYQEGGVGDEE